MRSGSATRRVRTFRAQHRSCPSQLYSHVVEIDDAVTAEGEVLRPLDIDAARAVSNRRSTKIFEPSQSC
jgi:N-methylhydantoinase A/oxoprolinase/acetone carboxylase beta subunit